MAAVGLVYLAFADLRPIEKTVPRVGLMLIAVGGLLVVLKDKVRPDEIPELPFQQTLRYVVGVSAVVYGFGWAFRNIGLATSIFGLLAIWFGFITYRDARRRGSFAGFSARLAKLLLLSAVVSGVVYFLFIEVLSMYLPRTPLP